MASIWAKLNSNAYRRSVGFLFAVLVLVLLARANAQRPMITGISHVTFYADDFAQSRELSGGLLGWQPVPANLDESGLRFYPNHLQHVELLPPTTPGQANRLDLVAFATSNAEGLRRLLASRGVPVPRSLTVDRDGSRSFLVVSVAALQQRLEQSGWKPPTGKDPQVLGVDGKLQLDLHDPDGTRIEFMEFAPVKSPCCSPYTGVQPVPSNAW